MERNLNIKITPALGDSKRFESALHEAVMRATSGLDLNPTLSLDTGDFQERLSDLGKAVDMMSQVILGYSTSVSKADAPDGVGERSTPLTMEGMDRLFTRLESALESAVSRMDQGSRPSFDRGDTGGWIKESERGHNLTFGSSTRFVSGEFANSISALYRDLLSELGDGEVARREIDSRMAGLERFYNSNPSRYKSFLSHNSGDDVQDLRAWLRENGVEGFATGGRIDSPNDGYGVPVRLAEAGSEFVLTADLTRRLGESLRRSDDPNSFVPRSGKMIQGIVDELLAIFAHTEFTDPGRTDMIDSMIDRLTDLPFGMDDHGRYLDADPATVREFLSIVPRLADLMYEDVQVSSSLIDSLVSLEKATDRAEERVRVAAEKMEAAGDVAAVGSELGMEVQEGEMLDLDELTERSDREGSDLMARGGAIGDKVFQAGLKTVTSLIEGTFEAVTTIANKMKEASPLLQEMGDLMDLAVNLMFMPLGNALGEIILPSLINMTDKVVDLWDELDEAYNGGGLGRMVSTALSEFVPIIGNLLIDIGDDLSDQGGIVGGIGRLLSRMGHFIETTLPGLLDVALNVGTFVMDNLKVMISAAAGFFAAHLTMMAELIVVTAAGSLHQLAMATAMLMALPTVVGGGVYNITSGVLSSIGMAEGGRVEPVPGGTLRLLAEAGEAETVVPDSKREVFARNVLASSDTGRGGDTYVINNYFYGMTQDEVMEKVRELIRTELTDANYRGGYL